jgi:hypothetical protein
LLIDAQELAPVPQLKTFTPKNDLPVLADYKVMAGEEFWGKFPKFLPVTGKSLIDADKLFSLASTAGAHDKARLELVCRELRDGANIGCVGSHRSKSVSGNAPSAFDYPQQVTDAIASWVKLGFVKGPVEEKDVPPHAKINGIMVRPKPNGSVRIILNLSAPRGNCVNEGIDNGNFPATMSSTKKWLAVLEKAGRGCYMMKIDWANAYKHVRVRDLDVDLQWFSWLGRYFVELCLIFGAVSSVGIYDRTAKVVLEVVLNVCKFPADLVCQHLDDVCAAAPAGSTLLAEFEQTYRKVAAQVGVMLAPTDDPEKAFSPCKAGTVLGVCYDTDSWSWCIPAEKVSRLVHQISAALNCEYLKQGEIWSLVGRILHYAPLIPAGRFNLDYLIKANSVSDDRRYPVIMTANLKKQLNFWLLLIRVSSGFSRIPPPLDKFPAWTREVYTDAAGGSMDGIGRGAGCVSEDWWAYVPWPRKINCGVKAADGKKLSRKLSALELVGPLICVSAGHDWCRNKPVRVWVDNAGSVKIWEKGYSNTCSLCTTLVKAIATVAAGLGTHFTIQKIRRCSGSGAIMADSLSKADFYGFRQEALRAAWPLAIAPATIPTPILAWLQNPVQDDDLGQKILVHLSKFTPVLGYS